MIQETYVTPHPSKERGFTNLKQVLNGIVNFKEAVPFYRKTCLLKVVGNWPNFKRYYFLDFSSKCHAYTERYTTFTFVPSFPGSWPVSKHQQQSLLHRAVVAVVRDLITVPVRAFRSFDFFIL